jgi:hypothetical protein
MEHITHTVTHTVTHNGTPHQVTSVQLCACVVCSDSLDFTSLHLTSDVVYLSSEASLHCPDPLLLFILSRRGHGKLSGFEVVKEVSGFVSYSFRPPPSPSSSSSAAVSLSVHHIISGECLSGGECGQDAEEALSLQQSLQDLNMRSRKHHPLPFIGRYLPVWVITETALYIMRNKSNTQ